MQFKKATLEFISWNGWDTERFKKFRDDFGVKGYYWLTEAPDVSASYFVKLLQKGKSARPPYGSARTYEIYLRHIYELKEYGREIFDHSVLWALESGQVICTAMPYGTREESAEKFAEMAKEFSFPESIKLKFLDDKYRYRPKNGHFMLMIYDENYSVRKDN